MTLSPGTRLGPYQIVAPLGAGGMGEVYRARDTNLNREVAIKVLPAAFAQDDSRVARFRREAQLVASLNHPNIATIHGLIEDDGMIALAFELAEGEDLAHRLMRGAIPVDEAITIARQIAEGLEAAHEKGIIHRDLKPANVELTNDGTVKILDFGLAKAYEGENLSGDDDLSESPTVSRRMTEAGIILGTAAYMSPEQARGKPVDKRSDIWSFGVVLFEMLTGKRLFIGETISDTLAAVLRQEVEFKRLPATTPLSLHRILERCLERDPKQRLRDIGEARVALSDPSRLQAAVAPQPKKRRMVLASVLILAATLFVVAGIIASKQFSSPSWPTFQRLTFRRGTVNTARFESDGGAIVYSAQWDGKAAEIFSLRLAGQESQSFGLSDAMLLSVSPSDELALKLHPMLLAGGLHGILARVPLSGGSPRELTENVKDADWSPDGDALAVLRFASSVRWLVEFPVGKVLSEEHVVASALRVSPDGARIAVIEGNFPWSQPVLLLVDRAGNRKVLAREKVTGMAWSRSGNELWFTSPEPGGATNLSAIDLSGKKRLVFRGAGSMSLQDISRNGDLLVSIVRQQACVMCRAPGASSETDVAWLGGSRVDDISPDGRMVLLNEADSGSGRQDAFYIRKTDGSPAIRLGEGTANSFSPDGKWVLARMTKSRNQLFLVPTGAGEPKQIQVPFDLGQFWLFPDGRRLLINGVLPNGSPRLYSIDLQGKSYRQIAPDDVDTFIGEMPISPDGKFVAAQGGAIEPAGPLQLFPADGGAPQTVLGFEKDDVAVRWADDGRSLFVFKRNQLPAPVFRLDIATGRRTPWLELMPAEPAGVTRIRAIAMTPDGRSYAYSFMRELSDLYLIRGLK